jgi:hypothetical protein
MTRAAVLLVERDALRDLSRREARKREQAGREKRQFGFHRLFHCGMPCGCHALIPYFGLL